MNHELRELRREQGEALDRLRAELRRRVALSQVNALLPLADPALVLPSPAVGLMAIDTPESLRLSPDWLLRSNNAWGVDGDVLLSTVTPSFEAHPWSVESAEWLLDTNQIEKTNGSGFQVARGLKCCLVQPRGTRAEPGWLTLWIDADKPIGWALNRVIAHCGERLLTTRRVTLPLALRAAVPARLGPLHYRLDALTRALVEVELPYALVNQERISLEIHFEDELIVERGTRAPTVVANVVPVWNSIDARYPDIGMAAQAVCEHDSRAVHVLSSESRSPSWKPWSIVRVGASGQGRWAIPQIQHPLYLGRSQTEREVGAFHLSYVPVEGWSPPGSELSSHALAIILSREAREELDRRNQRLAVDYRVTTGSAANRVPECEEFHIVDPVPGRPTARIGGRLLGCLAGGSDGFSPQALMRSPCDLVHALLPTGGWRSLGDVAEVFETRFSGELELVDERDLLHTVREGPLCQLLVRVRFRHAGKKSWERRAVLTACHGYLEQYLAGNDGVRLRLVDIGDSDERLPI